MMKGLGRAAASVAVILVGGAGGAYAADLGAMPVKAAPVAGPAICTSIADFFTTACQLSGYGVRFYGTVDVGGAYQTHGAPMAPTLGITSMLGKSNRGPMWVTAPNNLSVSNIGLQIKEPLWNDWSFVGQVEAGFNPYSGRLLDAEASLRSGIGVALDQQNAITAANFNGQFYNDLGFAGFSHPVWGTLTFGRQNSLGADQVLAYDPQQSAGSYSPLGLIGTWAGGGNTENRRDNLAAKYRVSVANWHFGAYTTLSGYDVGNMSTQAYYGNVGSDWHVGPGLLSFDLTGGWRENSVGEGPGGLLGAVNPITGVTLTTAGAERLSASVNNTSQLMAGAKYKLDRLQLFAGWDYLRFTAPDSVPSCIPSDESGLSVGCGAPLTAGGFPATSFNGTVLTGRIFQMVWVGGRYALTDSLDLSAGYYHTWQNQFADHGGAGGVTSAQCSSTGGLISIECAGTQDIASILLDWKLAPKWDTYIGTEYTRHTGGLASGYLETNDWTTSAGIRFRW